MMYKVKKIVKKERAILYNGEITDEILALINNFDNIALYYENAEDDDMKLFVRVGYYYKDNNNRYENKKKYVNVPIGCVIMLTDYVCDENDNILDVLKLNVIHKHKLNNNYELYEEPSLFDNIKDDEEEHYEKVYIEDNSDTANIHIKI